MLQLLNITSKFLTIKMFVITVHMFFGIPVKHNNQQKELTSTLSCQLSFYWIKV
jgi:hypothetical protein